MLRAEISTGSDFGKEIAAIINGGGMVADDIVVKLVKGKLTN